MNTQAFEVLAGLVDMLIDKASDNFNEKYQVVINGVSYSEFISVFRENDKPRAFYLKGIRMFEGYPADENHGDQLGIYEAPLLDIGFSKKEVQEFLRFLEERYDDPEDDTNEFVFFPKLLPHQTYKNVVEQFREFRGPAIIC